MLKPDLIEFEPNTLALSGEVNYNFDQMKNYVFGTADELKALVNSAVANLNSQLTLAVFTGKIEMYAGEASNIPEGWLLCDGREVSREEYSKLYEAIGVKYGAGNGVTTFNVPNYIGKFLEGGTEAGIVKEAAIPNIKGSFSGDDFKVNTITDAFYYSGTSSGQHFETVGGSYNIIRFDASRSSSVYKDDCNTVQPPSVTILYIIKT